MARYSMNGLGQTSNNTLLSHGVINTSASARRFHVWDMVFGTAASPADGTYSLSVLRTSTAAGTSTGMTPSPLSTADSACLAAGGLTFTVNPTLSVPLLALGMNQRSTVRWFAAPGEELQVASTQFNGIGVQPKSPSPTASDIAGTIVFDE
jgi:hypothetical protein